MGEERASAGGPGAQRDSRWAIDARVNERIRHALWAGMVSVVMLVTVLLDPVDQFFWLFQSRFAGHQPSGEIVFASVDAAIEDPLRGDQRADLAEALDELNRRGAGLVYLDLVFDMPSSKHDDARLGAAISRLGPRVVLVDRAIYTSRTPTDVAETIPSIAGSSGKVLDNADVNWLGFVWEMHYSRLVNGRRYQTFGASLGGQSPSESGTFPVDYGIDAGVIPKFELADYLSGDTTGSLPDIAGKTVVVGKGEIANNGRYLPGQRPLPNSYIAILAAETLRAGRTLFIGGVIVLLLTAAAVLAAGNFLKRRKHRRLGYAATLTLLPISLCVTAKLGIRIEIAYGLAFMLIYAAIRSRAHWRRRVSMIDQDTGLPTLRALEDRIGREEIARGHVVVAKVQGYEHVLRTLRAVDQSAYILKLVDRLRAADKELTVYFDGHFLGWHAPSDDSDALVEHLEGLRAIFAAPIQVSGYTVDVGITFGVARIDSETVRRIPAAIAAVEETNEASQPIKIAESGSQIDMLWDLSLRARIDEAMEAGEVYCVYQPKVDLRTGEMRGVEALVRWHDPHRGFISPVHFIQQCEKAGRMEHLTRYVLQSACTAGKLLHFRGHPITMSVNVSATLLGDMRIVGLVRNVLQATSFQPDCLILEVTETARITDLSTAASVLAELKSLGPRISIDDFGVGAANFEAFYQLPFDELKIDRLFVSNMVHSAKARAIAASIVAMGRDSRISIVAEGAETPEELAILNKIGCFYVQGYGISRPISLSNLLEFQENVPHARLQNMV